MEIAVERVFTNEILAEAAKVFNVKVEEKPLGDFEIIFLRRREKIMKITYYA